MSVKITKPWTSEFCKDAKLTYEQMAYALQTIRAWAEGVHKSDTGAGWGKGYHQQKSEFETREMIRIQMVIDMQHSGLLGRMLMGEEVAEQDPRDDPANYDKNRVYLGPQR
jgi:hypothetical protein